MARHPDIFAVVLLLAFVFPAPAAALEQSSDTKEDLRHVATWNRFADSLYKLHLHRSKERDIRSTTEIGGYGGYLGSSDFYRDVKYYDVANDRIMSRIQWETEHPHAIHTIQVFIYDDSGRLVRDYLAAYLPKYRNAPIQTLINFHKLDDDLHAFRQFDASGNRIYEQCKGVHRGEKVNLSLEDYEIPFRQEDFPNQTSREIYLSCFVGIPEDAGRFLDPLAEAAELHDESLISTIDISLDHDELSTEIEKYSNEIRRTPDVAKLYLKRGEAYFLKHQFTKSARDFDTAIRLDDMRDDAYFGRGMARGRQGLFDSAIADLTIYIERNPTSSLAYTKRGIRYFWKGDHERAARDLTRAIELNPGNAEAHDDLGVIHAQRNENAIAIEHFLSAIRTDPTFQKAYHNLALVYHLTGRGEQALDVINDGLEMGARERESLLLKSEILLSLGRQHEAIEVKRAARALPASDWSERAGLH